MLGKQYRNGTFPALTKSWRMSLQVSLIDLNFSWWTPLKTRTVRRRERCLRLPFLFGSTAKSAVPPLHTSTWILCQCRLITNPSWEGIEQEERRTSFSPCTSIYLSLGSIGAKLKPKRGELQGWVLCCVLQSTLLNGKVVEVGRWPSVNLTRLMTNLPSHGNLQVRWQALNSS